MAHRDYRADLDGLRAISIASVVLYHYGFEIVPGGFIGVDVFFVISGFLITSIIHRDLRSGSFTILGFYDRRIRRILPALMALLIACVVAGYYVLSPGDYRELGAQIAYSAPGFGNFYFLWNTGYFDQTADLLPLLNLWSLGVEEQFYLLWPLILAALVAKAKLPRNGLIGVLAALVLLSLCFAEYQVRREPDSAFYMLPSRAWELALGGLIVFARPIRHRLAAEVAAFAGILLILASVAALGADHPFPGVAALPCCLGAALVIWPKGHPTVMARVLSLRPMVFLGLISYSLYLWHWPILVFFRHYTNGEPPSALESAPLIALSIAISIASWRYIETPFRRPRGVTRVVTTGVATMAAMLTLGLVLVAAEGLVWRIPAAASAVRSNKVMQQWKCPRPTLEGLEGNLECVVGAPWDKAHRRAVVWGDSNAQHFKHLLDDVGKRSNVAIAIWHGCAPHIDNERVRQHNAQQPDRSEKCAASRRKILDWIARTKPDIVVMSASWLGVATTTYHRDLGKRSGETGRELMRDGLISTIGEIGAGPEIIILTDVPYFRSNPTPCVFGKLSGLLRRPCDESKTTLLASDVLRRHGPTNRVLQRVADATGARLIPINANMCRNDTCITELNGEFIYRNRNHIRINLQVNTRSALIVATGLGRLFVLARHQAADAVQ